MAFLKPSNPWLTRRQALKRSQDDSINHPDWRCICTNKKSWFSKSLCEICESENNVPLKFWHNGASSHVGYICNKCFNSKKYRGIAVFSLKGYMIYFGSALDN